MKEPKFKKGDRVVCEDNWDSGPRIGTIKYSVGFDMWDVDFGKDQEAYPERYMRHLTPLEEVLN